MELRPDSLTRRAMRMLLSSTGAAGVCAAALAASTGTVTAGFARTLTPQATAHLFPLDARLFVKHYMPTRTGGRYISSMCCTLTYGGGPVLNRPRSFVIFWHFAGAGDPNGVVPVMHGLFNNIGGSQWLSTVTQYYSSPPTVYIGNPFGQGNFWADNTHPIPAHPTDAQIQQEAAFGVQHFGFEPGTAYIVVSAHKHDPQGFVTSGWCAYHGVTNTPSGVISYTNLPYIPDGGSSCGANLIAPPGDEQGATEGQTIVAGHEYAGVITDPQPTTGWYSTGGEIGDLCAWINIANEPFGQDVYTMQSLYSNLTSGCVQ